MEFLSLDAHVLRCLFQGERNTAKVTLIVPRLVMRVGPDVLCLPSHARRGWPGPGLVWAVLSVLGAGQGWAGQGWGLGQARPEWKGTRRPV